MHEAQSGQHLKKQIENDDDPEPYQTPNKRQTHTIDLFQKVHIPLLFALLFINESAYCQQNRYVIRTVAFYNVENLFDTIDHPDTIDEDFTGDGKNRYTAANYHHKIENIASVIEHLGAGLAKTSPTLLGLAEIENFTVLNDLVKSEPLKGQQYQIIHFDSPDRRGIDVALLYRQELFSPIHQENIELRIWNENGERIYTRDLLWVSGIMDDEVIHILVNHWPSRRGGRERSEPKRMKAAFMVRKIIGSIYAEQRDAKIIIMGDFNDDPTNRSIKEGLMQSHKKSEKEIMQLFNPMESMFKKGLNTLAYRDGLNLFDQVLMSKSFLSNGQITNGLTFLKAGIYNPEFLTTQTGKYIGYPLRSFENDRYSGGFSDHYPVYVYLVKKYTER